jgi:hypothetical protein
LVLAALAQQATAVQVAVERNHHKAIHQYFLHLRQ